ncbi:MAG: phosphate ABC transporter substrate-binding protein PstS family protein [Spirulina sp.]
MISRSTTTALILLTLALIGCRDRASQLEREKQYQLIQAKLVETKFVDPLPELLSPEKIPDNSSAQLLRLPVVNPLEVEGNLNIAGSSTVFPLSQAIYERFIEEGYGGRIKISSIGSGAGFRLFCQSGETDISNASRPIKDTEIAQCRKIDRQPIGFRVGVDALAVVVHPENKFLQNATKAELRKIFTVEKWSDVNPNWPEELILRFIPDIDSGTLDFFVEELNEDKETLINTRNTRTNADDEILLRGVEQNRYAIGFLGYSYYQENANYLKILSIDGVTANPATVEAGSYPLSRPLFIYSDRQIMREKPQVAAFINYFLTYVNREIGKVGYFPTSDRILNAERAKFLQAIGE